MDYFGYRSLVLLALILRGLCETPEDCCLNDLCPYDCVRCDGTAQCFDLSDELGCSTEGDKKLNSYSKPPIFVPFVLKTITSQLRKEKEAVASRFPNRQCIKPPNVQNKPRNTYRTDTNEREEVEEGWSLRVMKFGTENARPPTTEEPVWLQLLRKLQAEQQVPPTTTTTTTTPAPTTTTDPPWLALLKNLIQVVKENSTTAPPEIASTEQQTVTRQTEPVQPGTEPLSSSIALPTSTTDVLIDTTSTTPTSPVTSSTHHSVQNLTSTLSSIMSASGDPLSTSARIISSLAHEKIATSIPFIVTQSSQTPGVELSATTKIARITTTNTSDITTDRLPNVSTAQTHGLSSTPQSNLSYQTSSDIEGYLSTLGKEMINKMDIMTEPSEVMFTEITQTTHSGGSTENVTGVPIELNLITTESIREDVNISSNLTTTWNTNSEPVRDVTNSVMTDDNVHNISLSSMNINDTSANKTINGSHLEKLGWNDTLDITESTVTDITGYMSTSTTVSLQDTIKTSTRDTMDTTFITSTDAPSIQSNIMKLIDKLLNKINETELEFPNSTSNSTTKFPLELKHFYTNFSVNETEAIGMKKLNVPNSSKDIRDFTPRVGLIEITEVTTPSMNVPTTSTDFTSITNDTTETNVTSVAASNIELDTGVTGLNGTTTVSSIGRLTNEENAFNLSEVIQKDAVLINSSDIVSEKTEILSDTLNLTTVSSPGENIKTTEYEVDYLLKKVRKTLNETRSRINTLADQIYSLETNATEMNATLSSYDRKDSSKPRLFKYGLLTDFQTDNGLSNFTVDNTVRVKPILQESNQRDTVTVTINDQTSNKNNEQKDSASMSWLYQTTSFPFDNFWDTITSQSPLLDSVFSPMPSNTIWSSLFDTWSLGTLGVPTTPRQQTFDTLPTSTLSPVEMTTKTPYRMPPKSSSQTPDRMSDRTPDQTPGRTLYQTTNQMPGQTAGRTPYQINDQTPDHTSGETLPTSSVTPVTYLQTEPPLANGVQIPVIKTQDFAGIKEINQTGSTTQGSISNEIYFVLGQGTSPRPSPTPDVTDPSKNIQIAFVTEPGVNFDNETNRDINTNFTISNIPIVTPATDIYSNSVDDSRQISNVEIISSVSSSETTTTAPVSITPYSTVSSEIYVIKPTIEVTTQKATVPTTMLPSATPTAVPTTMLPSMTPATVPTTMLPSATAKTVSPLKNKSQMSPGDSTKDKLRQDWWDQAFQPTTWFPFETQYPTNTPIPWNKIDKPVTTNIDPITTTTVPHDIGCMLLQDASAFCKDLYSGQYKNPDDCKTYFVCDWGDLYRCHCPPNTLFDGKLRVCNWDYAVTC